MYAFDGCEPLATAAHFPLRRLLLYPPELRARNGLAPLPIRREDDHMLTTADRHRSITWRLERRLLLCVIYLAPI